MLTKSLNEGSGGLMDKVSASQSWGCGFESHTGHDHDSSWLVPGSGLKSYLNKL